MPPGGGAVSSNGTPDPMIVLTGVQICSKQTSKISVIKPVPVATALLDRKKSLIVAAPPTTDARNSIRASTRWKGVLTRNPGLNSGPSWLAEAGPYTTVSQPLPVQVNESNSLSPT